LCTETGGFGAFAVTHAVQGRWFVARSQPRRAFESRRAGASRNVGAERLAPTRRASPPPRGAGAFDGSGFRVSAHHFGIESVDFRQKSAPSPLWMRLATKSCCIELSRKPNVAGSGFRRCRAFACERGKHGYIA